MNIFEAIIQGVVQGLTEFLPVSSSGHLVLSQHILGINENNLFFDVMLHLGTLIAVMVFYRNMILRLFKAFLQVVIGIFKGNFRFRRLRGDKNIVVMIIIGLIPLLLLFIPVGGSAKNIKGVAEILSNSRNIIVPGIFLIVTSLLLHIGIKLGKKGTKNMVEKKSFKPINKDKKVNIRISDALCIGTAQLMAAIFPGMSRSGSTLSVGLMKGINKQIALDYSFILGIPAIIAAAALELKEAFESGATKEISFWPVFVGIVVSAIVGFMAIKLFKWMLDSDKMKIFIIYTAVVGIVTIIIGVIEGIRGINLFTGLPI